MLAITSVRVGDYVRSCWTLWPDVWGHIPWCMWQCGLLYVAMQPAVCGNAACCVELYALMCSWTWLLSGGVTLFSLSRIRARARYNSEITSLRHIRYDKWCKVIDWQMLISVTKCVTKWQKSVTLWLFKWINGENLHFFAEIFGGVGKFLYLCKEIRRERAPD